METSKNSGSGGVKIIDDGQKNSWDNFVLKNKGEFLQSLEWGDFQKQTGKKIWRLTAVGGNGSSGEILAVALIIKHELPFGKNYLYCPRGPIAQKLKNKNEKFPPEADQPAAEKILELLFDRIKEIAQKEKSVFLRIEPSEENLIPVGENAVPCVNLQPQNTLILDITKPGEQLLAEMKQKTRYNIKLAEKRGVKIRISDKSTFEADFEKFWSLTKETATRDRIKTHPEEYYKKMFEALPFAKLFLAEFQGETLAANIVLFFHNRAVYLHGASSDKNRNLMAPYLLQWEQIKNARGSGFREYDFWGINKSQVSNLKSQKFLESDHKPNWQGITRFKTGFGGKEVNYPQAMDFVFQKRPYQLIKFAKGLKKFFRPVQVF